MSAASYRIQDLQGAQGLSRFAVSPMWQLLTLMLGGFALGLAWFLFNALALRTPTRAREIATILGGLAGVLVLGTLWALAEGMGYLPSQAAAKYALLPLLVWKLGVGYLLYTWQERAVELHTYYQGPLRAGWLPLVLAFMVRGKLVALYPNVLWTLVVA